MLSILEQEADLARAGEGEGFGGVERFAAMGEEVELGESFCIEGDLLGGSIVVVEIDRPIQNIEGRSAVAEGGIIERADLFLRAIKAAFGDVEHACGFIEIAEAMAGRPEAHAAEDPAFLVRRR